MTDDLPPEEDPRGGGTRTEMVVDTDTLSVPLLFAGNERGPDEPLFESALEAARDQSVTDVGKADYAVPVESDHRLSLAALPDGWDAPFTQKWYRDREYLPGDHFYEDLGTRTNDICLTAERGAEPFEDEDMHLCCRKFPEAESYPQRVLAVELDVDAGASMLAGLAAMDDGERSALLDRTSPSGFPSAYEHVAWQLVEAIDPGTEDWAGAAAGVTSRARRQGLRLTHAESYEFYGASEVRLGAEVTVGDGSVTVDVDRRFCHDADLLPHFWLFWAGTVRESEREGIAPGDVVAVGARAIEAVSPPTTPVATERLFEALDDTRDRSRTVAALGELVGRDDPSDIDAIAANLDDLLPYLTADNRLVLKFARQTVGSLTDADRFDPLVPEVDRWIRLLRTQQRTIPYWSILYNLGNERPEALDGYLGPLLEALEETGRSVLTDPIEAVIERNPSAVLEHSDRILRYAVEGEKGAQLASVAFPVIAERDPDRLEGAINRLVESGPAENASTVTNVLPAAPELLEPHVDAIAAATDSDYITAERTVARTLRQLSRHYPERVAKQAPELVPLCDYDDHSKSTIRPATMALYRAAAARPEAVAPHADAVLEHFGTVAEDDNRDAGPLAGVLSALFLTDLDSFEDPTGIDEWDFVEAALTTRHRALPEGFEVTPERLDAIRDAGLETVAMAIQFWDEHTPTDERVSADEPPWTFAELFESAADATDRRKRRMLLYAANQGGYGSDVADYVDDLLSMARESPGPVRGETLFLFRQIAKSVDASAVPGAAIDQAIEALGSSHTRELKGALLLFVNVLPSGDHDAGKLDDHAESIADLYREDSGCGDRLVTQAIATVANERPEAVTSIDPDQFEAAYESDIWIPNGSYEAAIEAMQPSEG